MYQKYNYPNYPINNQMLYNPYNVGNVGNDDRFIAAGGFLAPFLLGGIAGAAIAPNLGNNRPYYYNNYYYPYPPMNYNYYNPYYNYYYRR
ncbi:MAG: hypothetical protein PHE54_04070 [Bacilli bacterium]|nr:hypothetical protein [Bacilli bacterium]